MEAEPPAPQPSGTWSGSAFWIRFKPTRPSLYTVEEWCEEHGIEGHLPEAFHQAQAHRLRLSVEDTEVALALKLPECDICMDYIAFLDSFRSIHGPNHAARAVMVPFDSWSSKREANNYADSIRRFGRPSPPEFVPIVVAKQ